MAHLGEILDGAIGKVELGANDGGWNEAVIKRPRGKVETMAAQEVQFLSAIQLTRKGVMNQSGQARPIIVAGEIGCVSNQCLIWK